MSEREPEYISCDLCGQDDYGVLLSGCKTLSGPLVRCHQCSLVYVNPRNAEFAVNETTTDSSSKRIAVWKHYNQIWSSSLASGAQEYCHHHDNFELRIEKIQEMITKGSLLDIGCGVGHFLAVAETAGFNIMGIEPNAKTAAMANHLYDLNVITGVLPHPNLNNKQFDLITMLHVLEHLPSPSQELLKIHRILRPDGFLFIEVPTIDTIWFRLLRSRWRQLIPDHYFFFTPQTLHLLLEKQGFKVLDCSRIGKKMSFRFFCSRLWRYNKSLASTLAKLADSMNFSDRSIYLNLGDIMFIIAQRT